MLLRKQRLTQGDRVRQKNQKWKSDVAKQMLEKELEKKNKYIKEQEEARIEDERIRKYQQIISNRISKGNSSKRGKEEVRSVTKQSVGRKEGVERRDREEKEREKGVSHHNSKRSIELQEEEDIPLFPEIDQQKRTPLRLEIHPLPSQTSVQKQNQNTNQNKEQPIAPRKKSQTKKKRRQSTAKKREDTIESIQVPDRSNSMQIERLEEENKKLKQELHKKNETVESLLKLLRAQHMASAHEEKREEVQEGKEIGFTQYIKMDPENQRRSPPKVLFPSLNFKDAPIIFKFNLNAARRANSVNTAEFVEGNQQ